MQKYLPKFVFILLIILISITLGAVFLLNNPKEQALNQRIYLKSTILPFAVSANPLLDSELQAIGFWDTNALYLRNGTSAKTTVKKLFINIDFLNEKDSEKYTFRQTDTDGSMLIAGSQKVEENGNDNINVYISNKALGFDNPSQWLGNAFWNTLWQNYMFPKDPSGQEGFVLTEQKKGSYFKITR